MTLSTIIADHHYRSQPLFDGCEPCDEPWPCATVALLRECRDRLAAFVADEPERGCNGDCHGLASPGPCGACATPADYARLTLARLAEPEVTP
jgi:hypothetical protein